MIAGMCSFAGWQGGFREHNENNPNWKLMIKMMEMIIKMMEMMIKMMTMERKRKEKRKGRQSVTSNLRLNLPHFTCFLKAASSFTL
jgi:hypothetical protein